MVNRDETLNIMIFDPWYDGHHSTYLRYLLTYWREFGTPGVNLVLVLSRPYAVLHPDVLDLAQSCRRVAAQTVLMTEAETDSLESLKRDYYQTAHSISKFRTPSLLDYELQLFCQYAKQLRISQGILMYLCISRMDAALNVEFPCGFSGIFFNPKFHYSECGFSLHPQEPLNQLKEKFVLSRFLKHPQLNQLFCLDHFAVETARQKMGSAKITYAPDPIQSTNPVPGATTEFKAALGIDPKRIVFLLFGALSRRKGIFELLHSLKLIPNGLHSKVCLLLVGQPESSTELTAFRHQIQAIQQMYPIQIIDKFEFVPEDQVAKYFDVADVILATYPHHVGMSGILLRAAATGKPVLSSNFGLMGKVAEVYKMGITVNAKEPEAIAQGLTQFLSQPIKHLFSISKMRELAHSHSYENFCQPLLAGLQVSNFC